MANAKESYRYEGDRVREIEYENSALDDQFLVPWNSKHKTKKLIFVSFVAVALLVALGLSIGALVSVPKDKLRQDETKKVKGAFMAVARSCAELRDKYGVSESGIYQLIPNDSYHPMYSYCDFELRTEKCACDNLLNDLETGIDVGYFWVSDNSSTQPYFKFCFQGPSSCRDIVQKTGEKFGKISKIYPTPGSLASKKVYCDPDGWTVFQRRKDGSVDFYRSWDEYATGFGDMNGEFWLGLETIYQMTKDGDHELRVELADFYGNRSYAEYDHFSIGPASDKYRLSVSGFTGTAGDSFGHHDDMRFSTKDNENDISPHHCAVRHAGAWWYKYCQLANLNGNYYSEVGVGFDGVVWRYWKGKDEYLRFAEMKFRKKN